jgi:hypothetical protein
MPLALTCSGVAHIDNDGPMAGRALAEVAFHLFSLKVGLFFAPVVSAHCLI